MGIKYNEPVFGKIKNPKNIDDMYACPSYALAMEVQLLTVELQVSTWPLKMAGESSLQDSEGLCDEIRVQGHLDTRTRGHTRQPPLGDTGRAVKHYY